MCFGYRIINTQISPPHTLWPGSTETCGRPAERTGARLPPRSDPAEFLAEAPLVGVLIHTIAMTV